MALIRPCADLRNNYNEISKICHETKQPVFITKNGYNDLVLLSNDVFDEINETNNKKIDKLISEKFDKHYSDFEKFKNDIFKNIEIALKEIEDGKYQAMEVALADLEEKYGLS